MASEPALGSPFDGYTRRARPAPTHPQALVQRIPAAAPPEAARRLVRDAGWRAVTG